MSGTTKVVLGVIGGVALLVLASCGVAGWAFYSWAKDAEATMISLQTYEAIKVGQSEADLMKRLPAKQSGIARSGEDETTHPRPAGATCRYYLPDTETLSDDRTTWLVYRFCFASGKLTEKTRF
jgi:hypothetical protein